MLSQMQFLKYFLGRNNWTRVLGVLPIISLCTVMLASADDIKFSVISNCNYLDRDDGQYNAFWKNGQFMHICCMCSVGTKYTGVCNPTDPTSTVCERCENGTFRDYEPHLQHECEPQILMNCLDSSLQVLEKGSTIKASKCKCKPGTELEKLSKRCKVKVSGGSSITTTDSTILTKITQNASSAKTTATTMPSTIIKTNIPTYARSTTTVKKSVTDIKSTNTDTLSGSTVKTYTDHIKKDAQDYTRHPSWLIVLLIATVVLLLLLPIIYVGRRHCKTGSPRSDVESVKHDGPSSLTDLSSRSQLMNGNESPQPGCIGIMTRRTSSSVQAPNGAGPPLIRNFVQREDESITHVVNSVQTYQDDERWLVDDVHQNQEVSLNYILPAEKLDEFVQSLTMQWVHPCPLSQYPEMGLNDIKPVFRELFNSNHENTMKEIFGANPNDINEIVYNLMKAVQRNLGKDFTPQYIIEKLRKKHPQLQYLTDITVDLLEKYRVAETVQC